MGDRPQLLCAALMIRFNNSRAILAGLALAALVNCVFSALAGSVVNQWIGTAPLQIFYALSLLLAGIAMLAWRRPLDLLDGWRTGAFLTSFLGLAILQFGDKGQFIVAATAARTDQWMLAAAGGWIGMMAACVPAIYLQERLAHAIPVNAIRIGAGALFVMVAIGVAVSAWGLMG